MAPFCYNQTMTKSVANCEVCAIWPTNKPIFETDKWTISLAPNQANLGRCYVTLKEHKGDMAELTNEEWLEFAAIVKRLENAVRGAFGADLFNWSCLMNLAFQEAEPLPHVHWHVRPRYSHPIIFEGEEFTDPQFGYHYDSSLSKQLNEVVMSKIRSKLQTALL